MAAPIVLVGGWLSSPADYIGMARTLAEPPYNRIVYITDIGRDVWATVRDADFRSVLDRVARTVEIALRETGASHIDLIGHSAGGRVARAYLGDEAYLGTCYAGNRYVKRLITIGTAHSTFEVWVKEFAGWVNQRYPGAFYPYISYRAVAGRGVRGKRIGNPEAMLAWRSYEVSYGVGAQDGDGIVPTHCCYLEGADNLIIDGARHAPYNAPKTWYGAREVIPLWFD